VSSVRDGADRLGQVMAESRRLFNHLNAQAKAASNNTSSTLFGTLGGFLGTGIAYAVTLYSNAPLGMLAPILAGCGIVIGILAFRGTFRFKFESRLEMHQRALEAVRTEIKLLPRNAPEMVRDELWGTYAKLVSSTPTFGELAPRLTAPTVSTNDALRLRRGEN
jgi:hypothetical protein